MGLDYREQLISKIMLFLFFMFVLFAIKNQINWIRVKENDYEIKRLNNTISTINNYYKATCSMLEALRVKNKERLDKQTEALIDMNSQLKNYETELDESRDKIRILKDQLNDKEKQINSLEAELEKLSNAKAGSRNKYKTVYLTFDDGPSENTEKILDILRDYNIKATFFVIGRPDMSYLYKSIIDEGHVLGNHSYSHGLEKIYSSPSNFRRDIERLEELIYKETSSYPNVFRFPGGSNNYMINRKNGSKIFKECISILEEKGYAYFDWNVDSKDAVVSTQKKDVIIDSVLKNIPTNANPIILFHDTSSKSTTVEVLPHIIEELKKRDYVFDTLSNEVIPVQFFK